MEPPVVHPKDRKVPVSARFAELGQKSLTAEGLQPEERAEFDHLSRQLDGLEPLLPAPKEEPIVELPQVVRRRKKRGPWDSTREPKPSNTRTYAIV